jgi:hypothetical protein
MLTGRPRARGSGLLDALDLAHGVAPDAGHCRHRIVGADRLDCFV